jgi:PTS system nitrogen regulatory IIA component
MMTAKTMNAAPAEPRFVMRDLLAPHAVAELTLSTKREVIETIASRAATVAAQEAHHVFDVLWAREKLGTTGVGQGIAIPHGRVPGLKKITGYFARLSSPIAFEAVDDKPVDLVFVLLSPEEAGADHLHALAIISRVLRDKDLCDRLRKAKDMAALYDILTEDAG